MSDDPMTSVLRALSSRRSFVGEVSRRVLAVAIAAAGFVTVVRADCQSGLYPESGCCLCRGSQDGCMDNCQWGGWGWDANDGLTTCFECIENVSNPLPCAQVTCSEAVGDQSGGPPSP
jgi:hypothetical protein